LKGCTRSGISTRRTRKGNTTGSEQRPQRPSDQRSPFTDFDRNPLEVIETGDWV
jgi:hypothetical protein